ncbi:MAG TPA: hypothetical protein VFP58_15035 [Candidatus Eisenbacteria bacterium]|nr:hypothetical protein [Candidatus Eisenbacteria bacterium]
MKQHLGLVLGVALSALAAAPAAALPWFELTSSTGGSNLPFTIGQPFRQGDVPSGSNVVGSNGSLQVVAKNRWPDGSLKFAVVSGRATLSANAPLRVTLNLGTPPGGATLTTADLRATNVTASIGAGTFGSASWSGADFDAPFVTWVTGSEMSSWIYRKPIGGDAHLVGWMEVRLYAGGAVEVLPWVENGYLRVAAPTNKNATYTFTLNGAQRFSQSVDLLNHQRMVLASGSTLSYWVGTDPQIVPKHDAVEFQATKLVPTYSGSTSSGSVLWSRIAQSYTPLAQANYPSVMGTTGYHGSIGPLPEWDVAYLTSGGDPRAYRGVVINGYSAGRYGVHFRDETTNRPPRFSSYPNLVLGSGNGISDTGASSTGSYTPNASGGTPPTYKSSHHPSMGYMAYLLTGRFYFMEETQFVATVNYLKQNDGGSYAHRQGSKGILRTDAGANTTRGAAWAIRTLVQAATSTPDADPLRAEYVTSFEENVTYYHGLYVTTSNNPQGVAAPYSDYTTTPPYMHSMWMEDFLTFAFGYGKDAVGLSATPASRLDAFLAWKYQSIVGRLGGAGSAEYCYRDAAQYTMAVAPTDAAQWDGTDPASSWYSNWGQIYSATLGHANDCGSGTTLRGTSGGNPATFDGYWGNLLPAISYAVDHGAVGAAAAYARLTGASNYATGAATLNDTPVWGVRPRNATAPGGDTTPPNPILNLIAR